MINGEFKTWVSSKSQVLSKQPKVNIVSCALEEKKRHANAAAKYNITVCPVR